MTQPSLDHEITELRLNEIDIKQKISNRLREIQSHDLWEKLGFKSMKEFCTKELGYDALETREILAGAGLIVTQGQMVDSNPETQRRIDVLKSWRKQTASRLTVSAFLILSNRTLMSIAQANPKTLDELNGLDGIGPKKIASYGEEILKCLHSS